MRRLGHALTVQADPAQALAAHQRQPFDLILADWDLLGSGSKGLPPEALRTARLGCIAVTSEPSRHAQALLASGAPFVVPEDPDAVLDLRLGTMLSWRQRGGRDHEALRFLNAASAELASSLDFDTTLRNIAELGVKLLADGCVVDVIGDEGVARRVLALAREPDRQPLMDQLLRHPLAGPLRTALDLGETAVFRDAGPGEWKQFAGSAEHLALLEELSFHSAVVVPLAAHGRVEGVLTLAARDPTAFDDHAVGLAEQLGVRAGLAVANARLHRLAQEELARRRRVEEELRRGEAQFRALTEATFEAVVIHEAGTVLLVNRAMADMLGYAVEEMVGTSVFLYIAPESHPDIQTRLREGAAPYETLALHRDGSKFPIEVEVRGAEWDGRSVRMAAMRDIRERRRQQAQLIFADRLAAVGTLAAGVAHEINNPLAFVSLSVDFAREELQRGGSTDEVLRALDDAASGTRRVSGIVRDLGRISRVDDGRGPAAVRPALEAALGIARNEIRHRAALVLDLREVPPVDANESRLGQVFLNLLINAAQAVPEGAPDQNQIRVATFEHPSGRIAVEVSDSGAGIAPEVRPRIFDAFFTTKPAGVGTGLGLSICHGIVTSLGGEIEVDSAPGKGATFRVLLPRARIAEEPALPAEGPALALNRRPRVLVVDDEALLRRALLRMLHPTCDAVAVGGGEEALRLVEAGEAFDVILCDVMMPGMTGKVLFERLQEVAPLLARRTAFLSGGAFTAETAHFLAHVQNPKLRKPFLPAELLAVIRDLAT